MEMCEQKILNMFAYTHVVSPKAIQFFFSLASLLNCWLLHTHVQVMSQQETAEVCAHIIW